MPAFLDGAPAPTVSLLGWTGGEKPAFARSPEARDGFPDPLDRWSKRAIDSIAGPLDAAALYPFGGPPWHDFQRWALKAEAIYRSPHNRVKRQRVPPVSTSSVATGTCC